MANKFRIFGTEQRFKTLDACMRAEIDAQTEKTGQISGAVHERTINGKSADVFVYYDPQAVRNYILSKSRNLGELPI